MQIAVILGAPHMRIFSYLRYDGFQPSDLGNLTDHLTKLLGLAGHYDITLQLENEPVCNVGNIAELAAFFAAMSKPPETADEEEEFEERDSRRSRATCGPWSTSPMPGRPARRPSDADIAVLAPLTTAIHLKDRDLAANRTVPLGDGDVPWPAELKRLLGGVETKEVLASIETHCPQDGRNATARSLAGLRRIAAEIGVEVV